MMEETEINRRRLDALTEEMNDTAAARGLLKTIAKLQEDRLDALDALVQHWVSDVIGFGKKLDALELRIANTERAQGNVMVEGADRKRECMRLVIATDELDALVERLEAHAELLFVKVASEALESAQERSVLEKRQKELAEDQIAYLKRLDALARPNEPPNTFPRVWAGIHELRERNHALGGRVADLEASRTEHGKLILKLEQIVADMSDTDIAEMCLQFGMGY